jgi:hypothetical protein
VPGRYQFSLPERRNRDGWFRIGSIDVTTTAFMVLAGLASMVWWAIAPRSAEQLAYSSYYVRAGQLWRLFTWPLFNPPSSVWVVITLAFFWFVGHSVEDRTGRKRFTVLVACMTVIPALLVTIIPFNSNLLAFGLNIVGLALLVVFALDNPGALFFFGIPAWVLAGVFVAFDVLRYMGERNFQALVLELGVIAVGLVGARQCGLLSQMQFIPYFAGEKRDKPVRSKAKAGPKVVAGPWPGAEPVHSLADEYELNGLLDKISEQGMDSLSRTEKARLNELSKKLRGR